MNLWENHHKHTDRRRQRQRDRQTDRQKARERARERVNTGDRERAGDNQSNRQTERLCSYCRRFDSTGSVSGACDPSRCIRQT